MSNIHNIKGERVTTARSDAEAVRWFLDNGHRGDKPNATSNMDCNGHSPVYKAVKPGLGGLCTDPVSINSEGEAYRFLDNGHRGDYLEDTGEPLGDIALLIFEDAVWGYDADGKVVTTVHPS